MRLVKHPNVVDLRAFFYSNGDKVSRLCSKVEPRLSQHVPWAWEGKRRPHRQNVEC